MAERSENGEQSNSHTDRIREEVNKLLPDINFDDEEEDNGPVEIFSRGKYLADLELCDFDDEEEEDEEEITVGEAETLGSLPTLQEFNFSNGFGSALSRAVQPLGSSNQDDESLVSLMQRALRQLGDQGSNQTSSSTQPQESLSRSRLEDSVTSRGDGPPLRDRRRPAERRHVLFGGLSASEHEQARDKYLGNRKVTLKFGQRGDINLDELLRNVPAPDVDVSHYYDVEDEEEDPSSKNSALIQKLEEMSKKYEAVSRRGTSVQSSSILKAPGSQGRDKKQTRRVEFSGSTSDSATVIEFVPSGMQQHSIAIGTETRNMGCSTASIAAFQDAPGNERPTVVLDLRSQAPSLEKEKKERKEKEEKEENEEGEDDEEEALPLPPLIYGESSESSEDDEDEEEPGLWLDRLRRARKAHKEAWGAEAVPSVEAVPSSDAVPSADAELPTRASEKLRQKESPNGAEAMSAAAKAETVTVADQKAKAVTPKDSKTEAASVADRKSEAVTSVTSGGLETPQLPVSERVQQKIAEIKRREEDLRKRRRFGQRLVEQLPKDLVGDRTPLIFHEEESFSPAIPLLAEEAPPVVTLRFEQLAPGEIVTFGKRSRPIDEGRAVSNSQAALLCWLLSLAAGGNTPFRLLALQQSAPPRCTRLETHLALHVSGPRSQLQRFLASSSLLDLCPWAPESAVSSQKLSTYLAFTEGFEWRRLEPHFAWGLLRSDERLTGWGAAAPELQTSVLRLEADLFRDPGRLFRLLSRAQRLGLDLAGCRLLHAASGPFLALAFRGPRAVSALCALCGPGPGAVLGGTPPASWQVPRFAEAVPKLLARYFGGRLSSAGPPSNFSGLRHCLAASEASDLLLLASPAIPEASWLLRAAAEAGMESVGVRRLRVERSRALPVLGMTEAQAAVFAGGGCCHLIVLRRENAMAHAGAFVESAFDQLKEGQQQKGSMPPSSLLLYVMPCLPALLSCLDSTNIAQLPAISQQPISGESGGKSRPIVSEEEPCTFVVTHGVENRRLMLEVLDQTTAAELLAIKLIPRPPVAHNDLLEEVLGQRLNAAAAVCCALLRGLKLQDVLLPAMRHSNRKVMFARSCTDSIRLASAFFQDTEVIGDPRRRQLQDYLPECFLQSEVSTLASLCRDPPEMLVPFTVTWAPGSDRLWVVRRLWKWLEGENFRILSCSLDSELSASFLVLRCNALFRLDNGLTAYLSSLLPSARLLCPPTASDLPSEAPALPKVTRFGQEGGPWPREEELQETALLIVSWPALLDNGRGRSSLHLVLEQLSAKKLQLLACRFVELEAEAAAEVEMFGDPQAAPTRPSAAGPVLALLVFGSMARLGMRQLLRSKTNIAKMAANIFVPQSQSETLRMAKELFSFIISDAAICAQ